MNMYIYIYVYIYIYILYIYMDGWMDVWMYGRIQTVGRLVGLLLTGSEKREVLGVLGVFLLQYFPLVKI